MLQRQPRVGDIVDDYCPRERRLSDHAVVAMVGDGICQTRCTTCDTEHGYREAKVPPSRKKGSPVLPPKPPSTVPPTAVPRLSDAPVEPDDEAAAVVAEADAAPAEAPVTPSGPAVPAHEGSVHRRLIRAVLPRVEGETPTRQAPEFTMHRANAHPMTHGRPPHSGPGGRPRPGGESRHSGGPPVSGHSSHSSHSRPVGQRQQAPGNPNSTRGGHGTPGGHVGHSVPPGGGPPGRHPGGHSRRKKH
jgi:hypothetical protein